MFVLGFEKLHLNEMRPMFDDGLQFEMSLTSEYSVNELSQAVVLVADTDPESLSTISSLLVGLGHRVVAANSFQSALKLAKSEPLDLLITDTRLGNSNGGQLVDEFCQVNGQFDVAVLYLSASQVSGVIWRGHDFGGVYHLKKPVSAQVLVELVEMVLWAPHLRRNKSKQNSPKIPHFIFDKCLSPSPLPGDFPIPQMPVIF